MVIEYMGEQHYKEINCKAFKSDLEEQKRIDKEKYDDAIRAGVNYFSISYKDYNKIEKILSEKFGSTTNLDTSVSKE